MRFIFCLIFIGTVIQNSYSQECPNLLSPANNATNVSVDATISWDAIDGVPGYIISIGTSEGGGEILNNQAIGSNNYYKPSTGLPENTKIYVTITLFFFNQPNVSCPSESFTTENVTTPPECTAVINPMDGATNVNGATIIRWGYANKARGYLVSIGTTPGGSQIVNNEDVGNVLSFDPPGELDPDTTYYVRIVPYNENGAATNCTEQSFRTGAIAELPGCTTMVSPVDGATNVSLSPFVEWEAVPGATGYRVFIGKSPDDFDILDGGNFSANSTYVFNFESNTVYFIRIIPFNSAGFANDCPLYSFSTVLGCGPYYDGITGDLITLNPQFNFPEYVSICSGNPQTISADVEAQGIRWYKVGQFDDELLSEESEITIDEPGTYILEAYNFTDNGSLECPTFKQFQVNATEPPEIEEVRVAENELGLNIDITVIGDGEYEFALDSPEGPFQNANVFLNAPFDTEVIYVRDKGGCGTLEYPINYSPAVRGFPKFFTPNGDGYNDTWQYVSKGNENFTLLIIYIFDRYGKLLKSISPNSRGWDGNIAGQAMGSTDFWYQAITTDNQVFSGHFALKR